jgi:N6-adenosine-specific RNA methylase IME4
MNRTRGVLWEQGPFRLTATAMRVNGRPSLAEWGSAFRALTRIDSGTRWGLGDLMLYADERQWADEEIETLLDSTGLKRGTMHNWKMVARAFPNDRRRHDRPWSHHALAASLSDEDADALLESDSEHAWNWEEMRAQARARRRQRARERHQQEFPTGTFGVLLARPPWRSLGNRAQVMETDEIEALAPRVQAVTAPDAILYMVTSNAQLEDALRVMRAWGFAVRGHHVRILSLTTQQGEWMRERHELVLMGTRGRPTGPENPPDSVLAEHEQIEDVVEHAIPGERRLLLFNAEERVGWVTWGYTEEPAEPTRAIRVRHAVPA